MPTLDYDYAPVPTIRAFARDSSPIRGLMGPFGSGKSSGCVIELFRRGYAQAPQADGKRRTRWAVIRNTYPQLRDTTIKTFHDWFPDGQFGTWRANDHTHILDLGEIEAEIMFRALDRPEHVSNLLSLELTGAWVNEAREIDYSIIQALLGRVGRYPAQRDGGPSWSGIFMDTNPPDTDSWWFELFERKRPPEARLFRQPSGISPQAENRANLPANYYERLLALNSPDWCKVHVEGEYGFVQDGKPIYPDYRDAVHCSDKADYQPGLKVFRGWDFGLTPACTFSHLTPSGRWIVFDELVADNVGIERFSERVLRHVAERYAGAAFADDGDPAGNSRSPTDERTCFEILRAKGVMVEAGLQDVAIRLESVRKPLNTMADGLPAFALHPRCETLRRGFMGKYRYRRLQTSQERYSDEPEKNAYSHAHDALQYTATRLFGQGLKTFAVAPEARPSRRYGRRREGGDSWLTA